MNLKTFHLGLALAAALGAPMAIAQAWPSAKPVRVIVPYPAGGATDIATRAFAQSMSKRLNQAFVVENRAGAGGAVGLEAAAAAPPDGYTFIVGTAGNYAVNPHLMKGVKYDVEKSFSPVCMMALAPVALFANASMPAGNLDELVAWSKSNPGKLNFSTDGQATIPHIGGEYLNKQLAGLNMTHVPYKGSASATQAALAGDTQLALTGVANAIPHVRAGKLKLIGVAGTRRLSLFPDVPTLIEQGARGFDLGSWFAMFGPANVPGAVVEQMGKACRDTAAEPESREMLSGAALEVVTSTPEQLRDDLKRWGEMVTSSGVKAEWSAADDDGHVRVVAEGLQFPEGPLWLPDGTVLCVEIKARTLTAIERGGQRRVVAALGGGPNGVALGPDGSCYVCNNGGFGWAVRDGRLITNGTADDYDGGRIQKVDLATGRFETLYDRCDGQPLRGPNDLVFDAHGGFYFTDPGKLRGRAMDRGSVFYAKADGSSIREIVHPMSIPNGVGLSPDGRTLYVVETETARLWSWPITSPGEVDKLPWHVSPSGGKLVYTAPSFTRFDSLKVEAGGNICLATLDIGAVSVVSPQGVLVEQPRMNAGDTHCTNLCFGGADLRTAWMTLSHTGKLVTRRWPRAGLKLPY